MGASTSFHFMASNASWHSGVPWLVIFLFFLGLVEPVANGFAIWANPLTYLRRYDVRPINWRTVIWVVGIGKSSTALILYESFSTPFAETVVTKARDTSLDVVWGQTVANAGIQLLDEFKKSLVMSSCRSIHKVEPIALCVEWNNAQRANKKLLPIGRVKLLWPPPPLTTLKTFMTPPPLRGVKLFAPPPPWFDRPPT